MRLGDVQEHGRVAVVHHAADVDRVDLVLERLDELILEGAEGVELARVAQAVLALHRHLDADAEQERMCRHRRLGRGREIDHERGGQVLDHRHVEVEVLLPAGHGDHATSVRVSDSAVDPSNHRQSKV
jgi:hypothetical protein